MWEIWVWSLGQEDPLEKEMATLATLTLMFIYLFIYLFIILKSEDDCFIVLYWLLLYINTNQP